MARSRTLRGSSSYRATVAGIKSNPKAGFYLRVKFNPAAFDLDRLSQSGK